jgi:hypothetical protein
MTSGGSWQIPASSFLDMFVDADTTITNSGTGGTSIGGNPVGLHGSATLTIGSANSTTFGLATTTNSSFTGAYRVLMGSALSLGTPDTNGPAGWEFNPIELRGTNFMFGGTNASLMFWQLNLPVTYCGTLTGNGRMYNSYQGYGGCSGTLGAGGVISPGRPGTDEAGTIFVGFDRFAFASNATFAVNIASNGADLFDGVTAAPWYRMPVTIDPNANLNVKLWTPRTNWTLGAGATILVTSNNAINGTFKVNWQNSNYWSNLQVNYDTTSPMNRIYITGSYTAPPPTGTTIFLR